MMVLRSLPTRDDADTSPGPTSRCHRLAAPRATLHHGPGLQCAPHRGRKYDCSRTQPSSSSDLTSFRGRSPDTPGLADVSVCEHPKRDHARPARRRVSYTLRSRPLSRYAATLRNVRRPGCLVGSSLQQPARPWVVGPRPAAPPATCQRSNTHVESGARTRPPRSTPRVRAAAPRATTNAACVRDAVPHRTRAIRLPAKLTATAASGTRPSPRRP
jgi:hypothetical protein